MDKYNINENRPELTDEQIEKGMDFSKVMNKASATGGSSFYNAMITGIGGLVLILSTVLFFSKDNAKQIADNTNIALNSDANKPTTFMVDPSKDTTILFNTGSLITVPANSFVDANGNKVNGPVELNYREFHNVGEILLSGIPMTYDSAGTEYNFESAGMFELNAFQNGNPLFIANDKSIEVKMASLNDDKNKFNQYHFDEEGKKWNYTGEDVPAISSIVPIIYDSTKSPSIDLIKPVAKQKKQQQFTVSISYDEFPELIAFDNVLFEVSPENKNFDPSTATIKWDDVKIERVGKTSNYKITFINSSKAYEVVAYPVVDKNNLKKSEEKWSSLMNKYENKSMANENATKEKDQKLNSEISVSKKAVHYFKALVQANQNQKVAKEVDYTEETIYRTFQVKGFGIWNSDCPSSLPDSSVVNAKYLTQDGKPVDIDVVFFVESGKNALYKLYKGEIVRFDAEKENTLFVLTKDGSIGVFSKSDFKNNLDKDTKAFTFKLKMIKKTMFMPSDINDLI